MKSKKINLTIIANVISCVFTLGISYLLTPYYVSTLGDEAYGYVGLANTFIGYASILTLAFNAMAQRFITVAYQRNEKDQMNTYFWSVLAAESILSALILVAGLGISARVDHFFEVSPHLLEDVKITFAVAVINFVVTTILSVFGTSCFAVNRIELSAVFTIGANIAKVTVMVPLLYFFAPHVYFISIGGLAYTLVLYGGYLAVTPKILPELRLGHRYIRCGAMWTMLKYGVWSSLSRISSMLMSGLDLVLTNLFVGAAEMGILAIARVFIQAFDSLYAAVASAFHPQFTILYAKGKRQEMLASIKAAMRYIAVLLMVPCAGLIGFGDTFFRLWLPTKTPQEITQLYLLTVLLLMPSAANAMVEALLVVPGIFKHVKAPMFISLGVSVGCVIGKFVLLKGTTLGVFAIVWSTCVWGIVNAWIIQPVYVARVMEEKWHSFLPTLGRNIFMLAVLTALFRLANNKLKLTSWPRFFAAAMIFGALGYMLAFLLGFDRQEKRALLKKLKNRKGDAEQ